MIFLKMCLTTTEKYATQSFQILGLSCGTKTVFNCLALIKYQFCECVRFDSFFSMVMKAILCAVIREKVYIIF